MAVSGAAAMPAGKALHHAGLRDHERIYRAIEDINPERARFEMQAHMKTVERYWRIASSQVPPADIPAEQVAPRRPGARNDLH